MEHIAISSEQAADRLAIRELVDAYAHCADRREAEAQKALFTDDTHFLVSVPRIQRHADARRLALATTGRRRLSPRDAIRGGVAQARRRSRARSRPVTATRAPACVSASAIASPRPLVPPVTSARTSLRSAGGFISWLCRRDAARVPPPAATSRRSRASGRSGTGAIRSCGGRGTGARRSRDSTGPPRPAGRSAAPGR
jgi:predicted nucleic acid-binding protein